jgi:hypothetical protein
MMHSVRTELPISNRPLFEYFLKANDLDGVNVGEYTDTFGFSQRDKLCYAYSDKNNSIVGILTVLILKYGSLEKAYEGYKVTVGNSCVGSI